MTVKDASLSLVTKEIFKLNIERTPQLVESSGVFLVYGAFLYMAFSFVYGARKSS